MRPALFLGATIGLVIADAQAADVTVQPAAGSGFVVKDNTGATDRFRVQENGQISFPGIGSATTQTQALCASAAGQLGPCGTSAGGTTYTAGAGLTLSGTTFSVAPTFQLPQTCTANQIAQWSGSSWSCAALPSGGTSYTAGTGLTLTGTAFSVAPPYQLPQVCASNQIPQWNGGAWTCAALPAEFRLPYFASQTYSGILFGIDNPAASGDTTAISGESDSTSVNAIGVEGSANFGSGVLGLTTSGVGVQGITSGDSGIGVFAQGEGTRGIALRALGYAGPAAKLETLTPSNPSDVVIVNNSGTGRGVVINQANTSSTSAALAAIEQGGGYAFDASASTTSKGSAASFHVDNASNTGVAVLVRNAGSGDGMQVRSQTGSAITATALAGGHGSAAISASGYSQSSAGVFTNDSLTTGEAVLIVNYGTGASLHVVNNNTSDQAIFSGFTSNVARIDNTGKGFFNGGTQTGGADVAEFIGTSGAMPQPGDVVEIDPDHADSFRLVNEANTTRVAGVISTAPGVTLNDKTGADKPASGPALALAGRVPVKATNANGAIRIGDLLVASSVPGHAMRAPEFPVVGSVVGKALQNFDQIDGSIQMLVWAH